MHLRVLIIGQFLILLLNSCSGQICDSIEGNWYNQHGSEVIFTEFPSKITGELRTGVERIDGSAGTNFANLQGISSLKQSSGLIGFTAIFNSGSSVASWLGHCMKQNGRDVLSTTWLLKKECHCSREWVSTTINEDVFRRQEYVDGPRKVKGQLVPKRSPSWKPELKNQSLSVATTDEKLNGTWYADDGSVLELRVNYSSTEGNITGSYRSANGKVSRITGSSDILIREVFGLIGLHEDIKSAEAWVGQYHLCNGLEVLETSRLLTEDLASSDRTMNNHPVNYRHVKFTRTKKAESTNAGWFSSFSSFWNNLIGKNRK